MIILKKHADSITVILFCLVLAGFSILFWALPHEAFSQQENRTLAQSPTLTWDAILSGDFASETNLFFADQFPFRNQFVRLKSATELSLLKGENNGVLYNKGQLAVRNFNAYRSRIKISENTDRIYLESVKAQLNAVNALAEKTELPLITLIPPRTIDIAASAYSYESPDSKELFQLLERTLSEESGYIDTLSLLRPKFEKGEYVYYGTDHHWTTLGAYYAYCEIMSALGKADSVIPADSFRKEQIEGFSGTTAAKGSFPTYEKDILELWHLPDDDAYSVVADGEELEGFYSRKYLDTGDPYAAFLDGTHNITTITKPGEDRETLLIAKDSFANCLIPFLARSYNLVAVQLRTNTNLSELAEHYEADGILILYNTENLITSGDLGNIR